MITVKYSQFASRRAITLFALLILVGLVTTGMDGSVIRAQYFPPGPIEEGMPANLVLIYSGYYTAARREIEQPSDIVRTDGGDWVEQDFVPYVAHLDWDGQPDDTFFDSFLFLGLSSARGRSFAGERDQQQASLWADWQWYIDRLFAPGKQLAGLDAAVGAVGSALNMPDYTVNVYIMIPYPSYLVTDFGYPDGTMGGQSLLPVENRQRVVAWYVDEVLARWAAWAPQHVRLAGFYWLQEHINPAVPGEEAFVRDAVSYIQQRGYKMGWIPWSGAYLATRWRSYGFDWAIIQPNHMFQDKPGMLETAADRGRNAHMGIEIELDGRVRQPEGEQKLYDYLNAGVEYGFMRDAMIGYYLDLQMLEKLYYEESGRRRHMYDDIYAFAKGMYPNPTAAAGSIRGYVFDPLGQPIAGADVRSGSHVTQTDASGAFTLTGLYAAKADILIFKPGYNPAEASVATARRGAQGTAHHFTLSIATERVLHTFNTLDGLGGMGVRTQIIERDDGQGALQVIPTSKMLASFRVNFDPSQRDWSGHAVLAFDVYVPGETSVRMQLTLRDAHSQTHTRTFVLSPGEWQTVTVATSDMMTGNFHEPLIADSTGCLDTSAVMMMTFAMTSVPDSGLIFDHLRLLGDTQSDQQPQCPVK